MRPTRVRDKILLPPRSLRVAEVDMEGRDQEWVMRAGNPSERGCRSPTSNHNQMEVNRVKRLE